MVTPYGRPYHPQPTGHDAGSEVTGHGPLTSTGICCLWCRAPSGRPPPLLPDPSVLDPRRRLTSFDLKNSCILNEKKERNRRRDTSLGGGDALVQRRYNGEMNESFRAERALGRAQNEKERGQNGAQGTI